MQSGKAPERIAPARNYGVDTLRIVSMLMILTAHILTQGGILDTVARGTAQYYAAWLIRVLVICDVNCFALITGYVSVDSRFRISRPIALWLEVFAYSIGITLVFRILNIYAFNPLDTFFPVLSGRWWYVTAYFGMVFFTPQLASVMNSMKKKQASIFVFALILIFSFLPTIYKKDIFRTSAGYTLLWLTVLFLLGAYIKRFDPFKKLRRGWLLLYLGFMLLAFASKLIFEKYGVNTPNRYISFTSTPVLLGSISFLMFFVRTDMPAFVKKLTAFFSPVAFGVYLIHVHPAIWNYLLGKRFCFLAGKNTLLMCLGIFGSAIAIFIVCSMIDRIRLLLFKLLRVSKLADFIGEKLTVLADKVFKDE